MSIEKVGAVEQVEASVEVLVVERLVHIVDGSPLLALLCLTIYRFR
jgi:hypothetical protein